MERETQVLMAPDIRVVWRCLNSLNNGHRKKCEREKRGREWGDPQPLNFGQPVMYGHCPDCKKYRPSVFPNVAAISDKDVAETAKAVDGCTRWCMVCGKVERDGKWEMLPGGPLVRFNDRFSYENGRLFIGEPKPVGSYCPECKDPLIEK